ncbi:MAG: ChbG/HpnK family deacetylase [Chthoniobacteraceae bacterium]
MPAREILITGDDFGLSPEVNAQIERYHRAGALDRASLMVAAPHVEEAVAIARRNPALRVGLHLALCERSPALHGLRFAFDPRARIPLRSEIAAQFGKFRALGFAPAYWDGHLHLHLHPVVLRLTLPIAREHGFTFTRLVREPGPPALLPWIFERLSRAAIPHLRTGIGFADRVFGLRDTGRMTLAAFERAFAQAGEGTSEIYFHPGAEADPPDPDALARLRARSFPVASPLP